MPQIKDDTHTGRPTTDEFVMIRDCIMYPHLIEMVQKSLDDIAITQLALKNVVIRCMEHIMFAISDDYRMLKQEIRRRGIKIEEDGVKDGIMYFRFYCRGYDDRFGIMRETLRTELREKLSGYTFRLGKQLKK